MLAIPVCSCPKSQGTSATGQVGLGQGKPTGRGRSAAVTPATTSLFFITSSDYIIHDNDNDGKPSMTAPCSLLAVTDKVETRKLCCTIGCLLQFNFNYIYLLLLTIMYYL